MPPSAALGQFFYKQLTGRVFCEFYPNNERYFLMLRVTLPNITEDSFLS